MIYLVSNKLFDTNTYKICTVEESLVLLEPLDVVGVDTETEGFDPYTKGLLLVQLGNKDVQVVIDCNSIDLQLYKSYLESNRLFLFWNAKFDLRFFLHQRIVFKNVYDGFLAEKLLYLGFPPGMHGMSLADATFNYLRVVLNKEVRGMINYKGATDELVVEYAANDVRYLPEIREAQLKLIKQQGLTNALCIENEFVKVLAYIEYSGIKLDVQKWLNKMEVDSNNLNSAKTDLENWVTTNLPDTPFVYVNRQGDLFEGFDLTPRCSINWNSSKQVIPLLEHLGFNLLTKDKKSGAMKKSTEVSTLKKQPHVSTIIDPYIKYSAAQKAVSTYGQNFIDSINPITKRIHTQFTQLMNTSRLSSGGTDKDTGQENINLQNIPSDKTTRSCFVAQEGYSLICADYSGQESIVLTNYSLEPKLVEFFDSDGNDLHSYVAKLIFPNEIGDTPIEEVKHKFKDLRNRAKTGEFAVAYGGNGLTIANNLNISAEEGIRVHDQYLSVFSGLRDYFDYCKAQVWSKGYVLISEITGHKLYIHDWEELKKVEKRLDRTFWDAYKLYKADYNAPVLWGKVPDEAKNNIIRQFFTRFSNGESVNALEGKYEYIKQSTKSSKVVSIFITRACIYTEIVKRFFQRKGSAERASLNAPIQGCSAQISKIACIKYYNHLVTSGLLFIVLIPNVVHDRFCRV